MSKDYLNVRDENKQIIQTNSFQTVKHYQPNNISRSMYEALFFLVRRQTLYLFQLLKQFILFSDEEESIQVDNALMLCQLQEIQENIRLPLVLAKQRVLLDAFTAIKNVYLRYIKISQVYYQEENLTVLVTNVMNVFEYQKRRTIAQVFTKLQDNYRECNSKLNVSKIDQLRSQCPLNELQLQYKHFLGKIEMVNLSQLLKHSNQQDEDQKCLFTLKKTTQNFSQHKPQSKFDFKTPKYIKQVDQYKIGIAQTNQKIKIQELLHSEASNQIQQIYVVRNIKNSTRKRSVSKYIKIPLISENVKIIQIQESSKKSKEKVQEKLYNQKSQCDDCKYCQLARQRKELMKQTKQKIEKYSLYETDIQGESHTSKACSHDQHHYNQQKREYGTKQINFMSIMRNN